MKLLTVGLLLFAFPLLVFSQTKTSTLTGTVYDEYGAVVIGAAVTATTSDGKKFHTLTNDVGVYALVLPYNFYGSVPRKREARYDLVIQKEGFKPSEIKGYVFIPSQFGKMTLDIGLAVDCGNC